MSNHPIKPAKSTLSLDEQNAQIVNDALASLESLNSGYVGVRRVTPNGARSVVTRSLAETSEETYSARRHKAFTALSHFAVLVQKNKVVETSAKNTDLLAIAHPLSTKAHNLSGHELGLVRSRWYAADPRITDPMVASLLASAFTAPPSSGERVYALARLQAMGSSKVPTEALVAAFNDGANDGFWRQQLRDGKGRFAFMGGGLSKLVRGAKGVVRRLTGKTVSANPDTNNFVMELPNGDLVKTKADEAESIKAILPSEQTGDGYSKSPAIYDSSDPVTNEEDLEFVDSPDGWDKNEAWTPDSDEREYYGKNTDLGVAFNTDSGNYEVIKFDKPNAPAKDKFEAAQQKEAEGQDVVAIGDGEDGELDPNKPVYFVRRNEDDASPLAVVQSWSEVQRLVEQDEPFYQAGELPEPTRPEPAKSDANIPAGTELNENQINELEGDFVEGNPDAPASQVKAYEKLREKYDEEGGEFPIDPRKNYFLMDDGTIIDTDDGVVLRDSLGEVAETEAPEPEPEPEPELTPQEESFPEAAPDGYYEVDRGDYVPEGPNEGQTSENFTDDPTELAEEYSAADLTTALKEGVEGTPESPSTGFGYLGFDDGFEPVPAEAIYKALDEQGKDADQILDSIYKAGKGDKTPNVTPDVEEALGEDIPEAAQGEPAEQQVPPLIEGMTSEEQQAFLDSGDYKQYLPENKSYGPEDVPEGYYAIDADPFTPIDTDVPEGAPEGFSVNPVDIANDYNSEDLEQELRRSLTPEAVNDGYGVLGMKTPEGEDFFANVPAEAIRDALQLQGVETDEIIDGVYEEGAVGQEVEAITPETVDEILEAEEVNEQDLSDLTVEELLFKKFLLNEEGMGGPDGGKATTKQQRDQIDKEIAEIDAELEARGEQPADILDFSELSDEELQNKLEELNDEVLGGNAITAARLKEAIAEEQAILEELEKRNLLGEDVKEVEAPEETEAEEQPAPAQAELPADADPDGDGVATGEPDGPAKVTARAEDLKPGDVTAADFFTIENVFSDEESEALKPGSVWVEGYYPGHSTQKTKLWNKDVEIDVYRNVTPPQKGDLPELSKPKTQDYTPGKPKKNDDGIWVPKGEEAEKQFLADLDEYNKNLEQAKALWTDAPEPGSLPSWQSEEAAEPFTPANPVGVTKVLAKDVLPGDITFKKEGKNDFFEYFIVQSVEEKDGKAVLKGYYPGHESQDKEWNATTPIEVMRGATDLPEPGNLPALNRPKKDDPDFAEKKAAFDAAKKASAETFTPPLDPAEAASADKPKAKKPSAPVFKGEKLNQLLQQANGDPVELMNLLKNEKILFLDFETDGDENFSAQNPIQFGYERYIDGEPQTSGSLWMNPEKPLGKWYKDKSDEEILKDPSGNPISDEFLAKQQSLEEAFTKIFSEIDEDTIVVTHNVPFDEKFLKKYAQEFGLDYNPAGTIDTLPLSRKVINGGKGDHELAKVAARYGVVPEGGFHDAKVDTEVLGPILFNLLGEMGITKQGIDALDFEEQLQSAETAQNEYQAEKDSEKKANTSLITSKAVKDAYDGKEVPEVDEMVDAVPEDLLSSEEQTSATTPSPQEISDGDEEITSVSGNIVSNNWVDDDANTTDIGDVAAGELQPGDFIEGKYGGWFEVQEVTPDPNNPDKVFVRRKLLANGEEYGMDNSWFAAGEYKVRRPNGLVEETVAEESEPQIDTESTVEKWQGYDIKQDADGVFYADGISASDVQKLRNGELTPPQLPFFAPMGGGNKPDQGDGYFFSANGKRFWGKFGASGALVRRKNNENEYEYFLAKRSAGLSQGGGKWGYPGGAIKDKETGSEQTAIDEFKEEVGGELSGLTPIYVNENNVAPDWKYDTAIYEVGPEEMKGLAPTDGENSEVGWFTAEQMEKMSEEGMLQEDFSQNLGAILGQVVDESDDKEVAIPEAEQVSSAGIGPTYDTSNWKKVAGQKGTAAGGFFVDPDSGQQYYVKKPKGGDMQAVNEVLASALYEAAGLDVGRAFLGKNKQGDTVIVSPVIDGTDGTLGEIAPNQNILDEIKKGFAVDAWMNNYDVIGLEKDNIIVAGMKPYRIDAGGALLFRAQGADKAEEMNTNVSEQIDSLRDSDVNAQAASVFGDMTDAEIAESAKLVEGIDEATIDELVDSAFLGAIDTVDSPSIADALKENLKRRRKELIDQYNVEETPEPEAPESPAEKVTLQVSGDGEEKVTDLTSQINKAGENGQNIKFVYNGKEVELSPEQISVSKAGNVTVGGTLKSGKYLKYSLSKMEQSGATPDEGATPETPEAPEAEESQAGFEPVPEGTEPEEVEKPTEVPEGAKQQLIEALEGVANVLFGNTDPESIQEVLNTFKQQGKGDPEIIDAVLNDLTNPEPTPEPKETQEEKIAEDIAQLLDPELNDGGVVDAPEVDDVDIDLVAQELENPINPDIIWQTIIDKYNATTLDNGHIVISSTKFENKRFDVLVMRNSDNTFTIYHRITDEETGDTRIKMMKGRWHSFTAIDNRTGLEIAKSKSNPNSIQKGSKKETADSIKPSSPPKQSEAYVSADGKTVLNVGDKVLYVGSGKNKGQVGTVTSRKEIFTVKVNGVVYEYTDGIKVKFPDGEKANWKMSSYFMPEGAEAPDTDTDGPDEGEAPGDGGTPTPEPTPETPAPAAPEPETEEAPAEPAEASTDSDVELPTYSGPSMQGAETIDQVELNAVPKNSDEHLNAFGASNYSDYKEFLKGKFVKDGEGGSGKNMAPGILVQNANPSGSEDTDLISYGVVKSTNPADSSVEVGFVDGPLKGETQTLKNDAVWSREKFISPEQAEQLGVELDKSVFNEAKQKAFDKGKEYIEQQKKAAKLAEEKAAKEKAEKEEKAKKDALKAQFVTNGPGFSLNTAELPEADWSSSPNENVPSLESALAKAKSDTPLDAANGSTFLLDADKIEDLEVRVQKVTGKGQKEQIRLSFVVTDWAANSAVTNFKDNENIKQSEGIDLDQYERQEDGSLVRAKKWNSTSVDQGKNGATYSGKVGKGTFKLHRANTSASTPNFFNHGSYSDGSVSFHNKAEIYLPANATSADIQKALEDFGAIDNVRPATEQDIKGMIENKMIWLYGSETDGTKNFTGELRQQQLDFIEKNYGFTADDVEVVADEGGYGRVNYLIPESAAEKIVDSSSAKYFFHNWTGDSLPSGTDAKADYLYKLFSSGGLFATANRWMNGINSNGMSSKTDVKAVGGNYVFTHPSDYTSNDDSSSLRFFFDGKKMLRRMDWYKNNNDKYGQLASGEENNISKLSSGGGEVMFKKNLSWADLSGIDMPQPVREKLIEMLTADDNVVPNAPAIVDILKNGGK